MNNNPFAPFVGPFSYIPEHPEGGYICDVQNKAVVVGWDLGTIQTICSLMNDKWERVQKKNQKEEKV